MKLLTGGQKMNIKSLLLGSAAAFAVVSGAQAADAVVAAEPEPMEYVKVCDAYGTGFFYIPGTETCLKIGGQLRFEKKFKKIGNQDDVYSIHSRIRLNVEAKNDSEWGTVYSWQRIQGDQTNNSSQDLKWYYYFGIGGLEFGNYDSQWQKFFGYGGFTDDGGVYTYDENFGQRQYVSYTAEFGSIKAFISLDNDNNEYDAGGIEHNDTGLAGYGYQVWGTEDSSNPVHRGRKYMPDVSAGATATLGDWQVAGGLGYDESDESVALKGLVAGNFGMFGVRFMPMWSSSNENIYMNYDGFSAILGFNAQVTDTITLSKDIQFWDDGSFRIVGDVNWKVATGFSVLLEGIYADPDNGPKTKTGMLRFQRVF
jgi:hypothetical protein